MIKKPYNNRAWLGVLPVLLIVAFSAVIPLMTVVNYSVQDILDFNSRFYVGLDWYRETLQDPRFIEAFGRQVLFSLSVLAIEIPLGILVARGLPKNGAWTSVCSYCWPFPYLFHGTWWAPFGKFMHAQILAYWV